MGGSNTRCSELRPGPFFVTAGPEYPTAPSPLSVSRHQALGRPRADDRSDRRDLEMLRKLALALGVVVLAGIAVAPARADDGWRRHRDWREHEWREHHRYHRVYPAYPGYGYGYGYYYAPPP